jgi:predicted DNA-binding protein
MAKTKQATGPVPTTSLRLKPETRSRLIRLAKKWTLADAKPLTMTDVIDRLAQEASRKEKID